MSKEIYRTICSEEENIPVFSRDWWLDAVCGDNWKVLLSEKNGKIYAAMPLYVPCKGVVSMPDYTQTMGIWFASEAEGTKYTSLLEERQTVAKNFIGELASYQSFLQNFSYEFTDWLPFYWEGYSQTTRYTYILSAIKNFDKLWQGMSQQTRRNINKAQKMNIKVQSGVSIEDFLAVQASTFKRQNKKNKSSNNVLKRLLTVARERKQGEVFGGYDENGLLHAAAFVVWQSNSAYYVAGGSDSALRSSGAHSLVMWEAIQFVSQFTDKFDFEGSMISGVERFFREFGAVQTPYFSIKKGKLSLFDRICIRLRK
jgi:hypothetical protein